MRAYWYAPECPLSCFDLPIGDSFSEAADVAFMHARDVLQRAAGSSVALLSAPTLELEQAREARSRDLIAKPSDIDTLLQLVRALLGRRGTDPDSVFCYRMYSSSSDQERGLLCGVSATACSAVVARPLAHAAAYS